MNAQQIRRALQAHGHPQMVVGAGAAMVLRGLRAWTADIDVSVPPALFALLHKKYSKPALKPALMSKSFLFTIPGTMIDVHEHGDFNGGEPMAGVNALVMTETELLAMYVRLGREKDQKWITALTAIQQPPVQ